MYGGTSIGPVSKVGGEIENSIVQGFSNKQHDGYLGHSYLGLWVNLGAGTNTSDLKNDYAPVRVTIEGEEYNTNSLFVGLFMGDHSKSAIGTQFNTGTAVGVSCNIFSGGFPPKWIPNFSWVGAKGVEPYRYEKAIEVAKTVMHRRDQELPAEAEAMLRNIFNKRNL
jgi:UDP-N-acetylglucosamine diphosphorylase/glucosamine-1-phosphate N-acetyltransferase